MQMPLLRSAMASAILLAGGSTMMPQQAGQNQRIPQFDNAEVSVWRTVVMPDSPVVMHTHQHPRVIVALTSGDLKIVKESGPAETQHWEAGKAYWLSAEEGKERHADVNPGKAPVEVMVVELKNAR